MSLGSYAGELTKLCLVVSCSRFVCNVTVSFVCIGVLSTGRAFVYFALYEMWASCSLNIAVYVTTVLRFSVYAFLWREWSELNVYP